jgi:DNA-binding beta-propeller fold protein YncE
VFEAATGKVVQTIPLGGKPEFAAADGKGTMYVNIEDTNEIVELDCLNAREVRRFSLKPCEEPTGMGLDVQHGRVFSGCHNKVMTVLNVKAGKVIATIPIGANVDATATMPEPDWPSVPMGTALLPWRRKCLRITSRSCRRLKRNRARGLWLLTR